MVVVINFWFKSPSWSLLLPESKKFTFDMTFLSHSRALIEKTPQVWNSLLRVDLAIFQTRFSLCLAILTKLFQEVTHRNQLSVLLGQHVFNNFCNLNRLILRKGGFTPGSFPLKRAFLGESQRSVRRLFNQISSFRLETH